MSDDTDILLSFYNQARSEMRHIEEQRATTTNMLLVIMSAIVGFITQQNLSVNLIPVFLLMIALGIYGDLLIMKLYERHQLAQNRSESWAKQINKLHPKSNLLKIRDDADEKHSAKFAWLHKKLHVHSLWIILYTTFIIGGITMTAIVLLQG
ncbi:MAG: hypothetical protein HOP27_07465 [Anaerolineales bacterium]|nr:hypothetical protein [Anaerolineales bacterium]